MKKIPKKDENAEAERKDERERQKLKNKYPKEEFIGDMPGRAEESRTENRKKKPQSPPSSSGSMVLKRIPSVEESDDPDFHSQW